VDKPSVNRPSSGSAIPPTYKQEQYAADLVEQLREGEHFQAELFARKVLSVGTVGDMSTLIDKMKRALKELGEADEFVDVSHREEP